MSDADRNTPLSAGGDHITLPTGKTLPLASQRPSVPMDAPAIIRHYLFRIPPNLNPRHRPHNSNRHEIWAALIFRLNRCIREYQSYFGGETKKRFWIRLLAPEPEEDELLASESATFLLTPAVAGDYRARLRVGVYLETFAFTLIIDRIAPQSELFKFIRDKIEDSSSAAISALYGAPDGIDPPHIGDLLSKSLPLGGAELKRYFPQLSAEAAVNFKEKTQAFGADNLALRYPYATFHGLILPSERSAKFCAPGDDFILQDVPPPRGLTDRLQVCAQQHERFLQTFVRAQWIGAGSVASGPPAHDADALGAEAVMCGMLDGKALYASALSIAAAHRNRVNYLVFYDGDSEAQLGRFVHRLNVMGELRLSALMDYDRQDPGVASDQREFGAVGVPVRNLVEASQEIRRIGEELTKHEAYFAGADISSADEIFRDIPLSLDAIVRLFYNLNNCSNGGLIFRIERSKYYADAFRSRLKDLRIRRLEGWQPYDEFARRYLFQLYEMIASIGSRYDALGRRLDRLQSMVLVRAILQQARDSATQTTALAEQTSAVARQTESMTNQTSEIALQTKVASKLQRRAEDIAILAGTYYTYSALSHVPAPFALMYEYREWILSTIIVSTIVDIAFFRRRFRHYLIDGTKRFGEFVVDRVGLPASSDEREDEAHGAAATVSVIETNSEAQPPLPK